MTADGWHNLSLSEEQEMIVDTAARLAADVLASRAEEIDREGRFPEEAFEQLAELGFLGLPTSEESGGAAMGWLAYCLALEEIAKVCASTALSWQAHVGRCADPIDVFGSQEQKEEWVAALAAGECIGGGRLVEPAGSPLSYVADGADYVVSGRIPLVVNAPLARTFVISAAGAGGPASLFVTGRDQPGLHVEEADDKLGMRGAPSATLRFEGVKLGAAQRIGPADGGPLRQALARDRIATAAIALGLAHGACDRAARYSKERRAFGKTLAEQQAVALKLAEMQSRIAAARQLVYHACRLVDLGRTDYAVEAAQAKIVATECATLCGDEAIQIHGGYGYVSEYHVERFYRDAKFCEVDAGRNEECRLLVSQAVLGG